MALLLLLRGFVLMKLWNWFVPRVFHVETITIAQAIGLSILVAAFIRMEGKKIEEGDGKETRYGNVGGIIATMIGGALKTATPFLASLAFGWIFHFFVR